MRLIDQLEMNARLWELQAAEATHPKTREVLNKRAVRGRELAGRLKIEAAAKSRSTDRRGAHYLAV